MNTFKQFANDTIKASPILTEEEIAALLASNNHEPLWRYAYRIAGFVAVYVRQKAPKDIDDDAWKDAVQECMSQFPSILERYTKTDAPFLSYMSRRFQTTMQRYLWDMHKGGVGGGRGAATKPIAVDTLNPTDAALFASLESTAFGTRDPLVELMAEEAMMAALKYAKKFPRPGPKEL